MSGTSATAGASMEASEVGTIDMKLEVVTLPVSDIDRTKGFYRSLGWRFDGDIRSGEFAKLWIAEMDSGEAGLRGHRAEAANQLIETVGEELRSLMRREDASAVG